MEAVDSMLVVVGRLGEVGRLGAVGMFVALALLGSDTLQSKELPDYTAESVQHLLLAVPSRHTDTELLWVSVGRWNLILDHHPVCLGMTCVLFAAVSTSWIIMWQDETHDSDRL